MKTNNVLCALALAITSVGFAQARELQIPQMATASAKTEVVAPQSSVDPSEYGMGSDAATEQVTPPQITPKASAPAKSQTPAKDDLVQVQGGGRDKDLPGVSADVAQTRQSEESLPVVSSYQDVVVQPGVNTIIPAALDHLNRIVTPFDKPIVQTTSGAEIKTVENVIYVSTKDATPVTMYITPKDDESVAISLTLAPRKVPPIQANLIIGQPMGGQGQGAPSFGGAGGGGYRYSGQARKWEEGQPYEESIKGIMRALALSKLPKGYSIGKLGRFDTLPACSQSGISFDFSKSQVILGHNFRVVVAVARNNAAVPQMFDETACTHPNIAAVAAWPENMLEPGHKTEVYIITRVGEPQAEESSRPSLLN
ncbi:TPA: type-F conjugative transfer system secretin TraK [Pseudomonas aeruginosa]|nr:type-F conjugative transfer system secretin TraK [Pseudomonas aeruginosa]